MKELFGDVATDVLLKRLDHARATTVKVVIGYLDVDEVDALASALRRRWNRVITIRTRENEFELNAICGDHVDLLPVVVRRPGSVDPSANEGTEGFASALRDHFAQGSIARPRALVTLTPLGNETQKSASDGARDLGLLTPQSLANALYERHRVPADDPRRAPLVALLKREHISRSALLAQLEDFLSASERLAPEHAGKELGRLEGFFSDTDPGWASEPDRMARNCEDYEAAREAFDDPLSDTRQALASHFDSATVGTVLESAADLGAVDFSAVKRRPDTSSKGKNAFDYRVLSVSGAHAHHLTITDGAQHKPILAVAASEDFVITVGLQRPAAAGDHFHLVGWNEKKGAPQGIAGQTEARDDEGATVRVRVTADKEFAVFRVVLSGGPRAFKRARDEFWLVVYREAARAGASAGEAIANPSCTAVEVGCKLDLERQAWVQTDDRAAFDVRTPELQIEHVQRPSPGARSIVTEESDLDGDAIVARLALPKSGLVARVFWPDTGGAEDEEEDDATFSSVEAFAYSSMKPARRKGLVAAFKESPRYLSAVTSVTRNDEQWIVRLGETVRVGVDRAGRHEDERALGRLLFDPDSRGLVRTKVAAGIEWSRVSSDGHPALPEFLHVRRELLTALRAEATRHPWTDRNDEGVPVSLMLVDLEPFAPQIVDYLSAWSSAYQNVTPERVGFGDEHAALMRTDFVEDRTESGELTALTILPTHPWLLNAMLQYQRIVNRDLQQMTNSQKQKFNRHLHANEVLELASPSPFDDWFVESTRLHRSDALPFHWRFVSKREFRRRGGLDYLQRVVRNKTRRYLQMHRHLQTAERTLRIGFVNAGSGQHLLDGLRSLMKRLNNEEGGSAHIPNIEVLLFSTHDDDATAEGSALDEFFARSLVTKNEDDPTTDLLLQKLSYLKRAGVRCPSRAEDFVHICFFRGLVDESALEPRDQSLTRGWDSAFADGLLSTPLCETRHEAGGNRTERAVWIGKARTPLRSALAQLAALQRGSRGGSVDPELGLAWGAPLPTFDQVSDTYEHSDWVVHLDRSVGLDLFQELWRDDDELTVIEYSDQEDPETPGYDTVTVTRHAKPYYDQISKVLQYAGLTLDDENHSALRYSQALIKDINALSGAWAIDFILGNVSNSQWNNRLRGNVGAALAYRWLLRAEADAITKRFGSNVVPIYLSLEELIRVTPAAGLPLKDGIFKRFSNDDADVASRDDTDDKSGTAICDDLLVLYLTPPASGQKAQIFGRIIEVKFGTQPSAGLEKGIRQIRGTHKLLSAHLSGSPSRRDAIFRHKQLSLLLKARVEQAVIMGVVDRATVDRLKLPQLSAQLAAGDYEVEYTFGHQGKHVLGDVFLLATKGYDNKAAHDVEVDEQDGVRIIRMWPSTLDWLAFHPGDEITLRGLPADTVPDLGLYGGAALSLSTVGAAIPSGPGSVADTATAVDANSVAQSDSPTVTSDPETDRMKTDPAPPPEPQLDGTETRVSGSAEEEGPKRVETTAHPSSEPADDATSSQPPPGLATLEEANTSPIKQVPYAKSEITTVVDRLARALTGHKIKLEAPPSIEEADLGPRLVRVHVRLRAGEQIASVRKASEDLARDVGTESTDVHISNVPERHSIGIDLPIAGLSYEVTYDELLAHPSFEAASRELRLGFCAGIDVTGRAVWTDLTSMPHALVAGTTGSGKTVFLRQLLLTLMIQHQPKSLAIRLSSSKPMDFMPFAEAPHAHGHAIADGPSETIALVTELVDEMQRRIGIISQSRCDNLAEYNSKVTPERRLPYIVAVIDEYAETTLSISDSSQRTELERGVARLAQKSRAAGIHLVLCMQRPDSKVLSGPIKSNILHRFALKLPQQHDSRVILDENGAEALLGRGDMLYKNGDGRVERLQVPFLEKAVLERHLHGVCQ